MASFSKNVRYIIFAFALFFILPDVYCGNREASIIVIRSLLRIKFREKDMIWC